MVNFKRNRVYPFVVVVELVARLVLEVELGLGLGVEAIARPTIVTLRVRLVRVVVSEAAMLRLESVPRNRHISSYTHTHTTKNTYLN